MRSLQSKFLALTVGCVLLSALALGYVGFIYTHKLVNEDSAQFMNLFCEDKAEEINATLTSIEQSVNMIQDYTIEQYGELGKNGMDKDNTDVLVKKVQEVALHTVKNTEGSRGVYMRVNPELAGPQTGFFCTRMKIAKLLNIPVSIFQNMHRMIRSMSSGIMRLSKKKRRSGWSRMTIRIKMTGLFLMWCRYTGMKTLSGFWAWILIWHC